MMWYDEYCMSLKEKIHEHVCFVYRLLPFGLTYFRSHVSKHSRSQDTLTRKSTTHLDGLHNELLT